MKLLWDLVGLDRVLVQPSRDPPHLSQLAARRLVHRVLDVELLEVLDLTDTSAENGQVGGSPPHTVCQQVISVAGQVRCLVPVDQLEVEILKRLEVLHVVLK